MLTQSTSDNIGSKLPWQIKEINYGLKLLVVIGVTLLVLFIILPLFISILITITSVSSDELIPALLMLLIEIAILGVCVFGVYKLWPLVTAPTRTNQKVTTAPTEKGQPFAVVYKNPGQFARSYSGKGIVKFQAEQLEIEGTLGPSIWVQLGVIVVVTVVPLALFGCGLGLIPALLIAYWIGRKQMVVSARYADLKSLSVEGCTLTVKWEGDTPSKFKFSVMAQDGERLYRELYQHRPDVVAQWSALLR